MKSKLVIILAVLVLLVGGAAGAMLVFGIGPFKKTEVADAAPKEKSGPKTMTVDMEPLAMTIFVVDQKPRQIFMTLRIEILPDDRKLLNDKMPRLRDSILRDLHAFLPEHLKTRKSADFALIKPRMQLQADKLFGPGFIRGIYLHEVFEK
jgi:flagellar basal body-associated protein FliL